MFWILTTVRATTALQEKVRFAQNQRGVVLRLMLDMETGMRGYAATGRRAFLEPYTDGIARMPAQLNAERTALEALGSLVPSDSLSSVDQEHSLFERWTNDVARPLISNPVRPDADHLQRRGKDIVDRFRSANTSIVDALEAASRTADEQQRNALVRITMVGIIGFLVLVAAAWIITFVIERARLELQRQQELVELERHVTASLIKAFLPTGLPQLEHVSLSAVYLPAEKQALVGGDWFDALALPDGRLFVSVGDVGGHGVAAAVTMSRARQALLALAPFESEPGTLLARVADVLALQGEGMVTAVCGYVLLDRRSFVYASAGHPPPVYLDTSGRAHFLDVGGIAMGVVDGAQYESRTVAVEPGTMLVLYTDGLVEWDRDVVSGEARLLASVENLRHVRSTDPASAIRTAALPDGFANDDVAVLTLQFEDSGSVASVTATADIATKLPNPPQELTHVNLTDNSRLEFALGSTPW